MDNPFIVLNSEQLSSVIFDQDYLQLDFDGYKVTCYRWPTIILLHGKFEIKDNEYRNSLCSLIAMKVTSTCLIEGEELVITFETGQKITFDLNKLLGEVVYFTTPEGDWSSI